MTVARAALVPALLLLGAPAAAAPARFVATEIGTLGGDVVVPHGINNSGQIAGNARDSLTRWRAFRTRVGARLEPRDALPVPTGKDTLMGNGIAEDGTVVGFSQDTGGWETPYVWPAAGGVIEVSTAGKMMAINRAGDMVGCIATSREGRAVMIPFLRRRDGTTASVTTVGGSSCAYGINEGGWIIGEYRASPTAAEHAFLWNGTTFFRDLEPMAMTYRHGTDINGAGMWVVRGSSGRGTPYRSFWGRSDGAIMELLPPPGTAHVIAEHINDTGLVVGTVQRGPSFVAAMWHVGATPVEAVELVPRISGLRGEMRGVNAINDEGVLVAEIVGGPAVVITPVRLAVEHPGRAHAGRPYTFTVRNCEPGARVRLMRGSRRSATPSAHLVSGVRFDLDDVIMLGPEVSADASGNATITTVVAPTPGSVLLQAVHRGNKSPVVEVGIDPPPPLVAGNVVGPILPPGPPLKPNIQLRPTIPIKK